MADLIVKHLPSRNWWKRPRWEVVKSFQLEGHTVHSGFITDGASIPRPFWFLFSPTGNHMKAAILHDCMLANRVADPHGCPKERRMVDRTFYNAMKALGVKTWRAWTMWKAVRVFYYAKLVVNLFKSDRDAFLP